MFTQMPVAIHFLLVIAAVLHDTPPDDCCLEHVRGFEVRLDVKSGDRIQKANRDSLM